MIRSVIAPAEQASWGGKQICSMAIACPVSSGFISRNINCSEVFLSCIPIFLPFRLYCRYLFHFLYNRHSALSGYFIPRFPCRPAFTSFSSIQFSFPLSRKEEFIQIDHNSFSETIHTTVFSDPPYSLKYSHNRDRQPNWSEVSSDVPRTGITIVTGNIDKCQYAFAVFASIRM